jgi:hypothetical protein
MLRAGPDLAQRADEKRERQHQAGLLKLRAVAYGP